jgi:hypothetical protein
MPAAHKSAPIRSLGLKSYRERPIRTERVHRLYGHVGRRRRGSEEGIARPLRIGLTVGGETIPSRQLGEEGGSVFRVAERTNALRAPLQRMGVKHAVV